MKLINRINLTNLILSIIIISIGSVAIYNIYRSNLEKARDEGLIFMMNDQIERMSERERQNPPDNNRQGNPPPRRDRGNLSILTNPETQYVKFTDTLIHHPPTNQLQPYRKLSSVKEVNGKYYKAELYLVAIEGDTVLKTVIYSMTALFIIMIMLTIGVNYVISKNTFKPFYKTLEEIKNYNLTNAERLNLSKSSIKEFSELNEQIDRLTKYVRKEYENVKEFSENASHEYKTPVAIIKSKLELLIQNEKLTEEQFKLIDSCFKSIDKLKKLNDGLTLLIKIENNEFKLSESINIKSEVNEIINYFQEMAELKEIKIKSSVSETEIKANKILFEILLSNLISNAIRYNKKGGLIEIFTTENGLTISNTSEFKKLDSEKIFNRFYKENYNEDSVGLGLSISKKICELFGFEIKYSYENSNHNFTISF
ncbi:MAG TPA: HAMP domain-containing sensor histidine kinase [Ignavibacteria bacterium]|nr:HAMP domain-containing sensor histidine kinase [Ignavibacteria bacterium]